MVVGARAHPKQARACHSNCAHYCNTCKIVNLASYLRPYDWFFVSKAVHTITTNTILIRVRSHNTRIGTSMLTSVHSRFKGLGKVITMRHRENSCQPRRTLRTRVSKPARVVDVENTIFSYENTSRSAWCRVCRAEGSRGRRCDLAGRRTQSMAMSTMPLANLLLESVFCTWANPAEICVGGGAQRTWCSAELKLYYSIYCCLVLIFTMFIII